MPVCLPALAEDRRRLYPGRLEGGECRRARRRLGRHLVPPIKIVANHPYTSDQSFCVRWLTRRTGRPNGQSLTLMSPARGRRPDYVGATVAASPTAGFAITGRNGARRRGSC